MPFERSYRVSVFVQFMFCHYPDHPGRGRNIYIFADRPMNLSIIYPHRTRKLKGAISPHHQLWQHQSHDGATFFNFRHLSYYNCIKETLAF